MSLLETYIRNVHDTRGLLHQRNLRALRLYINTAPEETLLYQIRTIQNIELLRTLWEAGLNTTLQQAVLRHIEMIQKGLE